ncbi:HAD superfamily hydrolase (TIGR01509 family) [Rhodobacter viridis]|uniref:HAD superfamily hydrolase (TIGR01509 family) n=1 Tax=Rhodobacter viridis TaxID=1054202 RepID=A0A318U3W5_9RHOB|nr:HAD family hydrolase [Rhodobacter viridis]PYF13262.1 HAD superfamily hydrolase (TIGR01509 family) [Rhodobacter viridis]
MFDLIIFDCDGVLIDSEIISAQMLIAELALNGVEIDLDYVATHFLGRSYPTVLKQIRTEFGLDLPADFEARYRERLLAAFEREMKVMPGVTELLDRLALPWCVATSSSRPRAERSLEIADLAQRVGPRLYTASQVERGKPAPDLFFLAAREMGTDPARCLVIEDSLNGIRAGLAAGMTVWRFTGGSHLRGRDLTPPEDARPALDFDDFARFETLWPGSLRTKT